MPPPPTREGVSDRIDRWVAAGPWTVALFVEHCHLVNHIPAADRNLQMNDTFCLEVAALMAPAAFGDVLVLIADGTGGKIGRAVRTAMAVQNLDDVLQHLYYFDLSNAHLDMVILHCEGCDADRVADNVAPTVPELMDVLKRRRSHAV